MTEIIQTCRAAEVRARRVAIQCADLRAFLATDFGETTLVEYRRTRPHRFSEIRCSQCGCTFGSGNFGYSHCRDHLRESRPERKRFEAHVRALRLARVRATP